MISKAFEKQQNQVSSIESIIAEFDEYFFSAVTNDPLVAIITGEGSYENFLIVQRTTSDSARFL